MKADSEPRSSKLTACGSSTPNAAGICVTARVCLADMPSVPASTSVRDSAAANGGMPAGTWPPTIGVSRSVR
jgi:hypothetical protein